MFDPTIFLSLAFLFGIAAQFRAADGSSFLRAIISSLESKVGVLFAVVLVTAFVSPFILNDVLILILTPVLIARSKESGADIAPLLVAEVTFTNLASALTPIGNPQNILLWQASGVSAAEFVEGTWLPVAASGLIAAIVLLKFRKVGFPQNALRETVSWRAAGYLASAVAFVFVANVLGVSSVFALALAFALGFAFTFRSLGKVAKEFDSRSLLVLCALVGVIALATSLVQGGLTGLTGPVASGAQPQTAEYFGAASAVISNVPATQLVLSTATVAHHSAPILAVDAGLAGNIDPVSSFANLLALMMVRRSGLGVRRSILLQLVVGLVAFLPALI